MRDRGWLGLSIGVWFFFLGGLVIGIGWGRLGARRWVWASGRGRTDGMGWDEIGSHEHGIG